MNKIIPISTEYFSPSKTIEILNLVRLEESRQVYIYNFEGKHFRFFGSLIELIQFFELGNEPKVSFESEEEMDEFLKSLPIKSQNSKMNLKLNYRYRDRSNYKEFGFVVFSNISRISPLQATKMIKEKLIQEEFFVPQEWNLKRLHTQPYNPEVDHEWHEFEEFEWTEECVSDNRDISEFLEEIEKGYEI